MLRIKKIIESLSLLTLFVFISVVFLSTIALANNAAYNYRASALDTVLGNDTYLTAQDLIPNSDIEFILRSPDGEYIYLPARTNKNGTASLQVDAEDINQVGDYLVFVRSSDNMYGGVASSSFSITAAPVDSDISILKPSNQTVDGEAVISVQLLDEFSTPVAGHYVELISSVDTDDIVTDSNITNESGIVEFNVSSISDGVSVYTAYDTTSNVLLTSRAQVLFLQNGSVLSSPNQFEYMAIGNSDASGTKLKFTDIPEHIYVGDVFSFTLESVIGDGDVSVTDYVGKVRFTVESDDVESSENYVNFVDEYEFTDEDLGKHVFSLESSFLKAGVFDVTVRDIDNLDIAGEYTFTVLEKSGNIVEKDSIYIVQPATSTVTNNVQVVTGIGPAGKNIGVYDGSVLLGDVTSDFDGNFSYTTPMLSEGVHDLYVAVLDDLGTNILESAHVMLTINLSSPEITDFSITPSEDIKAGETILIDVVVSSDTTAVSLVLNNEIYDLIPTGNGHYVLNFSAPAAAGEYAFDFTIENAVGIKTEIKNYRSIEISEKQVDEIKQTTDNLPILSAENVSGLVVEPHDKRVVLKWNPVAGADHYIVYYGDSSFELINAVDTFTNDTTWYIPNLENGHRYYFAVAAVSAEGVQSEQFSEILSAMPVFEMVSIEKPPVVEIEEENPVVNNYHNAAELNETGPALNSLILLSLFAFWFGHFFLKKTL